MKICVNDCGILEGVEVVNFPVYDSIEVGGTSGVTDRSHFRHPTLSIKIHDRVNLKIGKAHFTFITDSKDPLGTSELLKCELGLSLYLPHAIL